ncbi:PRP40 pre-mRNA processing factor 40 [Tyrophagus putrescentiae]|nr:PRP40 pre-mRNA processing factor 40 [Tyrophagus putrescentiae]
MQNPNGHFAGHFAGVPPVGTFPTFAGAFPPPAMAVAPIVPATTTEASKTSPWIEYKTPEGKPYYFNPITRQTVWEKPAEMQRGSSTSAASETSSSSASTSAGPWVEYKTDDGKVYYHNTVTNVTSWTKPAEMTGSKRQTAMTKDHSPPTSEQQQISAQLPSSTPPSNNSGENSKFKSGFFSSPPHLKTDNRRPPIDKQQQQQPSTPFSDPSTTPPQSPAKSGGNHHHHSSRNSSKSDYEEFKEILLEKKIASNASWENCLKYVAHDARFTRFRSHPERKTFFNQYKTMRIREEKEEQRHRLKAAQEALERFLRTSERVWTAVPEAQRREIFEDALTEITREEREKAKELRKRNMTVLSDVLDSMNLITYRTTWEEAQLLLFDNPIFAQDAQLLSMDKEDALIVFQEHIRQLEEDEATEKANERKMKAREQRRNREAFLKLLDELHAIRPLDLFKFYVEELKARYEDEKALIRSIMKSANFVVGPATEFSEFVELLSIDPRSGKLDSGNVKLMHEKLVEREREKEKERLREEARSKKKLEQGFIGPAGADESAAAGGLELGGGAAGHSEGGGLCRGAEERVAIFEDVVRSLVENCTHRHNYKSSHKGQQGQHKSSSLDRNHHHHHHHASSSSSAVKGVSGSRSGGRGEGGRELQQQQQRGPQSSSSHRQQSSGRQRSKSRSSSSSDDNENGSLSDISEESDSKEAGAKADRRSRSRSSDSDMSTIIIYFILISSSSRHYSSASVSGGGGISKTSTAITSSSSSSRNVRAQSPPPPPQIRSGHRRSRDRGAVSSRSPSPLASKRAKGLVDYNNGSSSSSSRTKSSSRHERSERGDHHHHHRRHHHQSSSSSRHRSRSSPSPPSPRVVAEEGPEDDEGDAGEEAADECASNEPDIEDLEMQRKKLLEELGGLN